MFGRDVRQPLFRRQNHAAYHSFNLHMPASAMSLSTVTSPRRFRKLITSTPSLFSITKSNTHANASLIAWCVLAACARLIASASFSRTSCWKLVDKIQEYLQVPLHFGEPQQFNIAFFGHESPPARRRVSAKASSGGATGRSAVSDARIALPNFDDVAVRIANVTARLAVFWLRLRDELGSPTSP